MSPYTAEPAALTQTPVSSLYQIGILRLVSKYVRPAKSNRVGLSAVVPDSVNPLSVRPISENQITHTREFKSGSDGGLKFNLAILLSCCVYPCANDYKLNWFRTSELKYPVECSAKSAIYNALVTLALLTH